jgi:hypothetical protein
MGRLAGGEARLRGLPGLLRLGQMTVEGSRRALPQGMEEGKDIRHAPARHARFGQGDQGLGSVVHPREPADSQGLQACLDERRPRVLTTLLCPRFASQLPADQVQDPQPQARQARGGHRPAAWSGLALGHPLLLPSGCRRHTGWRHAVHHTS